MYALQWYLGKLIRSSLVSCPYYHEASRMKLDMVMDMYNLTHYLISNDFPLNMGILCLDHFCVLCRCLLLSCRFSD